MFKKNASWGEWIGSFFFSFDAINKKLAKAKTNTEKLKVYEEIINLQQQEIIRLATENSELKEDAAEINSGGSSSTKFINSKIEKRKEEVKGLINNSKKSTAHLREIIKLLGTVQKLEVSIQKKDSEIEQLKEEKIEGTESRLDELENQQNELSNLIEQAENILKI